MKIMVLMNRYTAGHQDRRQSAVLASASEGVDIGFGQVGESAGWSAPTRLHRSLVAPAFARQALAAERAGYNAVIPWGTLDLGVEEARRAVSIPVLGPGRTSANLAASLVDRFAVLCYGRPHQTMFETMLRGWGLDSRVTSVRHVDMHQSEMAERPDELWKRFVEQASRAAADEGAELILPLGYSMVPVELSAAELSEEIGVPVLDPLVIVMRVAEALVASGTTNSRVAYPRVELE